MKIGALARSIRLPLPEAAAKFQEMGMTGIQLFTSPEYLTFSDKKMERIRQLCAGHGLEVTAVCGDIAHSRPGVSAEMEDWIDLFKKIIDITCLLGSRIVTSHIGVIPDDVNDPVFQNMAVSLGACAEHAAKNGAFFAIETGPERAETLLQMLETVNSEGLKVNFDPANLRMVSSIDPVHAVKVLGKYIVHTHAKDGINHTPGSAAARYGLYRADGSRVQVTEAPPTFAEVPLGEGQVPWKEYLAALAETGYDGYLTIEREQGTTREKDIRHAVDFLRERI